MIFNDPLRFARAALIETLIGPSPRLIFYTGPAPAFCSQPASGILLAVLQFSADWLSPPTSNGQVSMVGSCATGPGGAVATGQPGYFRIVDSADVVWAQGLVPGDLIAAPIVAGAPVSLIGFNHQDT